MGRSLASIAQPAPGRLDFGLGGGAADPGRALDAFARLKGLVDLEKVLDLEPVELRQVVDIAQVLLARVVRRDAQDLVVAALLIGHPEHADPATAVIDLVLVAAAARDLDQDVELHRHGSIHPRSSPLIPAWRRLKALI